MTGIIRGRVWILGDNIDTDQMAPYPFGVTWDETRGQMFPGKRAFVDQFRAGDIIVAGSDWGCGSSREQATENIKRLGAAAVVAESFSRLFFRNGIAIGLPCIPCQGIVDACADGDSIEIDLAAGQVRNLTNGRNLNAAPYPDLMLKILASEGLMGLVGNYAPAEIRSQSFENLDPGQTIAEKILARASGNGKVSPGDMIVARADRVILIEFMVRCVDKLNQVEVDTFWDADKVSAMNSLQVPAPNAEAAATHRQMRDIAADKGVTRFYDYDGIVNQVIAEKGDVLPGQLVFGTDSHSTSYGALGAAGTGLGVTDMSFLLATGQLWLQVPQSIRLNLDGEPGPGLMSKDIILYLLGRYGTNFAQYKSIEFTGPLARNMSIASRQTISNMGVEMGAKFAIFAADDKTLDYLRGKTHDDITPVHADLDANYAFEAEIDVSDLVPQVARPHNPGNVNAVSELDEIPVDQVFLGSCTNARLEDLAIAAQILEGHKIASTTRLLVTPASKQVMLEATRLGYTETLLETGAVITASGCGACPGGSAGVLGPGDICLSTSNRNFKGRMGSPDAFVYLASPATAAASAITGRITDPREFWPESNL